jgi:hypothetical protein
VIGRTVFGDRHRPFSVIAMLRFRRSPWAETRNLVALATKRRWNATQILVINDNYFCRARQLLLGVDLLRRRKPDQFREVGRRRSFRIDRERVAFAT